MTWKWLGVTQESSPKIIPPTQKQTKISQIDNSVNDVTITDHMTFITALDSAERTGTCQRDIWGR